MIALLLAAFLSQQRVDTDAGCIQCHESQAEDWRDSAHAKNAVGCVKCHGADSVTGKSRPHLFVAGFLRGTKKTNPALCAACHRPEFEAFDGGAHGEDTRDDAGKMKGCSSCHGFHATDVADRRAILKEACASCHKEGSRQLRWGERFAAARDPLRSDALRAARVGQHGASAAFLERLEKQALPVRPAYNTRDSGPPWGLAAASVATLGAALAWILRGQGRQAS